MYEFRGYDEKTERWIHGKGLFQSKHSSIICDASGKHITVKSETVGKKYILRDSTNTPIYQGDIIRYSFIDHGNTYSRYYRIVEDELSVWAEELWRDYDLDCETMEVTRLHNIKYSGEHVGIDYFNTYKPTVVVGNIWQNPELLK